MPSQTPSCLPTWVMTSATLPFCRQYTASWKSGERAGYRDSAVSSVAEKLCKEQHMAGLKSVKTNTRPVVIIHSLKVRPIYRDRLREKWVCTRRKLKCMKEYMYTNYSQKKKKREGCIYCGVKTQSHVQNASLANQTPCGERAVSPEIIGVLPRAVGVLASIQLNETRAIKTPTQDHKWELLKYRKPNRKSHANKVVATRGRSNGRDNSMPGTLPRTQYKTRKDLSSPGCWGDRIEAL